jgi:acetyl-CoA acetyltransferase
VATVQRRELASTSNLRRSARWGQRYVSEVLLAGGAESMSNAPFYSTEMGWGVRSGPGVLLHDA